jgi:hypothetical protein
MGSPQWLGLNGAVSKARHQRRGINGAGLLPSQHAGVLARWFGVSLEPAGGEGKGPRR